MTMSTAPLIAVCRDRRYVMIPVALMVASQQYEVDHALDIIGGGAPPNLKPAGCMRAPLRIACYHSEHLLSSPRCALAGYPLEYECEACELSQEFSSFYGEDIWLCSS